MWCKGGTGPKKKVVMVEAAGFFTEEEGAKWVKDFSPHTKLFCYFT